MVIQIIDGLLGILLYCAKTILMRIVENRFMSFSVK